MFGKTLKEPLSYRRIEQGRSGVKSNFNKNMAENPYPRSGTFWHIHIKLNLTKIAEN